MCKGVGEHSRHGAWMCEHGITCALRWGVTLVGDFRYWRYTRRRNRSKKLVEKKTKFGFVLYPVNFG